MTRILIVDDHAVVRQGLKKILSEFHDMEVTDEAQNADELMKKVQTEPPDIVVLDISMPGRSGIDVLRELHSRMPKLPVLFLSMLPEEQFALRALKAGASGYLTKDAAPDELVKAIRRISAGRKYISPALAEKLASVVHTDPEKLPHEKLSEREFQVFRKIASGEMLTQIAEELYLSIKTVATYRTRVLSKMHMQSNADLTRYAVQNKLIE